MKNEETYVSIVVPCYNEADCLEEFYTRTLAVLRKSQKKYEFIFINDGSEDASLRILLSLKNRDSSVRIINVHRNSGHMNAIGIGLRHVKGSFIVTLDADLQDPPEYIEDLLKIIIEKDIFGKNKYDVVQTVRVDRISDTLFKKYTAKVFYSLMRKITSVQVVDNAADFRIMSRDVVELLSKLPEQKKIYRFLIPHLGFKTATINITRDERFAGTTKYPVRKMVNLAIDSAITFSNRPLLIASLAGFIFALIFLGLAVCSAVLYFFGITIPGWASIIFVVLASNSLFFAFLGLLGAYISRVYDELKSRPSSIFEEV
jgi:glycosyltransferase involved in cell wall biosynthesis